MASVYSGRPEFVPTEVASPVGRFVLQLVSEGPNVAHAMGTATLIAGGLAITAAHVLDQCVRAHGALSRLRLLAIQYGTDTGANVMSVGRVYLSRLTDLAVLEVKATPDWLPDRYPAIDLRVPARGEKVFAFGYPGHARVMDENTLQVCPNGHTATGTVLEVFNGGRDRAMAPFPCFSTNARFDDAMSGGAVFDQRGALRGVVCSSLPASEPGVEDYSLVTLLWPSAAIVVHAPWSAKQAGEPFPFREFFAACGDRVRGVECVEVGASSVAYKESVGQL